MDASTDFTTLTWETDGHVVLVGLNRPDKMNAFNLKMLEELGLAFSRYEKDAELRCLILHAHGKHFTSGLDLAEVGPAVQSGKKLFPENAIDPLGLHPPYRDKPVICVTQGWCLTIGIELMLACDIRIAATNTRFSQMEIKRGIMPFGGATLRMPQLTGWGNAMRYLLTADEFDAHTAYRIGLVQEIADEAGAVHLAREIAGRVAKQAPLGVQETIKSARVCLEQGFDAANARMLDQARSLMTTKDAREGIQSFIERREAQFLGE